MRTYYIRKAATGSWLPFWSHGFVVAVNTPCTDEPRIRLNVGDFVQVTRWKRYDLVFFSFTLFIGDENKSIFGTHTCLFILRYWLFGEKVQNEKSNASDKNGLSGKEKAAPKSIRIRGWFPRNCAVELMNPESDDEQEKDTAKKVQ